MKKMTVKVTVSDHGQLVVLERRRCPAVGSHVKYQGRRCLVVSTEYVLEHRVHLEAFTATG